MADISKITLPSGNTYDLAVVADNIKTGYVNTHPENLPVIIPFINNDIAHLLKRGGSATVAYDGTTQSVNISNVFDGSASYWEINPTGITTIVIELTLHQKFKYGNVFYVDFGKIGWRAKSIKIETALDSGDWTQRGSTTSNSLGHYYINVSIGATGYNKLRFTFSSFAHSTIFRIAQLGVVNYSSLGSRQPLMSRGNDDYVFRNITPNDDNTYNLGSSERKWRNVFANTLNGTTIPSNPKFTDTTIEHLEDGAASGSLRTTGATPESTSYALGVSAFAQGFSTQASGAGAHAEGYGTKATGAYSHTEGSGAEASGEGAHAEGDGTIAIGDYSHVEGLGTSTVGAYSHAEGYKSTASGYNSHAEGQSTTASGSGAHAEGQSTTASGAGAHAEGASTQAAAPLSHAEGSGSKVDSTQAAAAHAEGMNTVASRYADHAEGSGTKANGGASHAEGASTQASGNYSHAEGESTTASGSGAHAEGYKSTASGQNSHAEGQSTTASGQNSHAEGYNSTASGYNSHAGGYNSQAKGLHSFAHGDNLIATRYLETVIGTYNAYEEGSAALMGRYAFVIGNGSASTGGRSNCFAITWGGALVFDNGNIVVDPTAMARLDTTTKLTPKYGTCSTDAATAEKVVTLTDSNFELQTGAIILVKFSVTNTADNPTLNVNGTGAKSIYVNTGVITTASKGYAGTANRPIMYMYDGTQWVFVSWSNDNNTTYTNMSQNEASTGTATTPRSISAKVLQTTIKEYVDSLDASEVSY